MEKNIYLDKILKTVNEKKLEVSESLRTLYAQTSSCSTQEQAIF